MKALPLPLKEKFAFAVACCLGYIFYAPETIRRSIRQFFGFFILISLFAPNAMRLSIKYAFIGVCIFIVLFFFQVNAALWFVRQLEESPALKHAVKSADLFND